MQAEYMPAADAVGPNERGLHYVRQDLTTEDIQRMAAAEKVHIIETKRFDKNGNELSRCLSKNSRVSAGAAAVAALIGSAAGVPFNYIALSTATLSPAAGDTTLTSESVVSGLARKISTYGSYTAPTSLNGTATYVLSATFTNNGGSTVTIVSCACFNASSAGTMLAEANLANSEVLNASESLSFSWTFTV